MDGKTEEEIEMMKLMGFSSFDSSKVRAQGCAMLCSHKEVQCVTKFISFYSLTEDEHTCLFVLFSVGLLGAPVCFTIVLRVSTNTW